MLDVEAGLIEEARLPLRLEKGHRSSWSLADRYRPVAWRQLRGRWGRQGREAILQKKCRSRAVVARYPRSLRTESGVKNDGSGDIVLAGVKYRAATAKHPFVQRLPGKPDPRAEVIQIPVVRILALPVDAGEGNYSRSA